MKKWLQNLSSAVIASLLAISLNGKAYANDDGPPAPVEPPLQAEQPAGQPASQNLSADTSAAEIPVAETPCVGEVPVGEAPSVEASVSDTEESTVNLATTVEGNAESLPTDESADENAVLQKDEVASDGQQPALSTDTALEQSVLEEVTQKKQTLASGTLLQSQLFVDSEILSTETGLDAPETPAVMGASLNRGVLASSVPADNDAQQNTGKQGDDQQEDRQITVAGTSFTPDTSTIIRTGWTDGTDEASGSGWAYDGADGSIVLVGYDGSSVGISSVNSDVTIKAAGFNRLSSLSVDGNINLIGTGILLVDKLEMAANKEFSIQPNKEIYGEDYRGGVAVFLKQDNDDYLLINGTADAILDEKYEIPAGVTLVVPGGSKLVMQSVAAAKCTKDGEETLYYSLTDEEKVKNQLPEDSPFESKSTSPLLKIMEQAKLVIQDQASLVMNAIERLYSGTRLEPLIEVAGTLELGGTASGGVITVNSGGDLIGSGSFSGSTINVAGGRTNPVTAIHVQSGVRINLLGDQANLGALEVSGSAGLTYHGNTSVDTLNVSENGRLECFAYSWRDYYNDDRICYGERKELSFIGGISGGGSIDLSSGVFILGEECKIRDNTRIEAKANLLETYDSTAEIFDYYLDENGKANLTQKESPRVETRETQQVGDAIPFIVTEVKEQPDAYDRMLSILERLESVSELRYSSQSDGKVNYQMLVDAWKATYGYQTYVDGYMDRNSFTSLPVPVIVLETEVNGKWGTIRMTAENPGGEVSLKDIRTIRLVLQKCEKPFGQGGGSATSTNTACTGSGVLGGSGAGSVSGGKQTSIWTGSGITKPQSPNDNNSNTGGKPDNNTGNTTLATLAVYIEDNQETTLVWVEESPTASSETTAPAGKMDSEETAASADTIYVVRTLEGEKTLKDLGGKAAVSMSYTPPAEYEGKTLYVVFRDENNKLVAFRATYSDTEHLLRFITKRLGEFMVVGFDFDSAKFEEFSPEFYEALAKLPELENLVFSKVSPV